MNPRVVESSISPDGDRKELLVTDAFSARKRPMSWLATTIILVSIGFASLCVAGIRQFGSVSAALAYLRGDGLIPDVYTRSFGIVDKNERPTIEFSLTNYTEQPIKVVGSNSSCTCLVTSDLPMVVPPHARSTLRVAARSRSRPGPYSERIHLLTETGVSELVLIVRGVFE